MAIGFIPGTREGSSYIVRASDAHAWPELYFEGSGWLRFEPTASRSGPPAYSVPGLDTPGSDQTAPGGGDRHGYPDQDRAAVPGGRGRLIHDDVLGRRVADRRQPRHPHHRSRRGARHLPHAAHRLDRPQPAPAAAATRQDLVEIEWDALMSHFDDLGLSAPPGATLRSARERYITDGHLDDEHASAMRRVTATLERARARPTDADHSGATASPPGHSLDPSTGVGHLAWTTRARSFLWPTEGVSVWRERWVGWDGSCRRDSGPAAAACWSDARAKPRGPLALHPAPPPSQVTVGGEEEAGPVRSPGPASGSAEGGAGSKICIVYGTTEGQTAKIADVMAQVIRAHGDQVATVDVKQARDGLTAGYDGVVVGASIHMGKHDKHAVEFVRHNRELLERVPSGFFSVSLACHYDLEEAEGYLEQFQQET